MWGWEGRGLNQQLGHLGSQPISATDLLCELAQIHSPSVGLSFLICNMRQVGG